VGRMRLSRRHSVPGEAANVSFDALTRLTAR